MRKHFWLPIAMTLLLGVIGGAPLPAQDSGTFRFCIVPLRDAGDPMVDQYRGQPRYWYFSGVYNGDTDKSEQFLSWAQGHFGREWTVILSQPNRGITSFCRSYATLAEARKALGSPASDGYQSGSNAYFTHTGWPDIPADNRKRH